MMPCGLNLMHVPLLIGFAMGCSEISGRDRTSRKGEVAVEKSCIDRGSCDKWRSSAVLMSILFSMTSATGTSSVSISLSMAVSMMSLGDFILLVDGSVSVLLATLLSSCKDGAEEGWSIFLALSLVIYDYNGG